MLKNKRPGCRLLCSHGKVIRMTVVSCRPSLSSLFPVHRPSSFILRCCCCREFVGHRWWLMLRSCIRSAQPIGVGKCLLSPCKLGKERKTVASAAAWSRMQSINLSSHHVTQPTATILGQRKKGHGEQHEHNRADASPLVMHLATKPRLQGGQSCVPSRTPSMA